MPAQPSSNDSSLAALKKRWAVYSHGDLKRRCKELGSDKYLVESLVPGRSIALVVGDSGLGKSALVYQLALCVASGLPFLGCEVKRGPVLYLDFENGLGQVDEMLNGLGQHLGLSGSPDSLMLWNVNDCQPKFGQPGHTAIDLIRAVTPLLVVIDSLTGLYPDIEEKNSNAVNTLQQLRKLAGEIGASVLCVHHIRKPSTNQGATPPPLETCPNVREWFLQTRGARALINGTDVRLGVDEARQANTLRTGDKDAKEIALVLRGFGRVRGEIPLVYLCRESNEDGEPLGYSVATGARLLFNPEREAVFAKLPETFRFKHARQALGKGDSTTDDFLKKCTALGLARKVGKFYKKTGK